MTMPKFKPEIPNYKCRPLTPLHQPVWSKAMPNL